MYKIGWQYSNYIGSVSYTHLVRKDAISTLVSAAKKVAIDEGCRDDIREELVDRVILKEIKSVKEQIDTCPASREDLLAEYKTRYDIFMEYAPKMMSADEVEAFITEKFADEMCIRDRSGSGSVRDSL